MLTRLDPDRHQTLGHPIHGGRELGVCLGVVTEDERCAITPPGGRSGRQVAESQTVETGYIVGRRRAHTTSVGEPTRPMQVIRQTR